MSLVRPNVPAADPDPPRAPSATRSPPVDDAVIGIFVLPWQAGGQPPAC